MSQRVAQLAVGIVALLGLAVVASQFVIYVVDQRELAVVLRFGQPVRSNIEPGMYFKTPFVESVRLLPSTLQFWGDRDSETLPDLPTKDNKKIEIKPWAVWKINDPIAFVEKMRTMENAENRVAQFARGAMRDVITQYDLEDLVRSTDREIQTTQAELDEEELELLENSEGLAAAPKKAVVGRQAILDTINKEARKSLASNSNDEGSGARGIELVSVGISHIDFVEQVRRTTFERWIAEREAISTGNIKEGEQQKQEILNMTNREIEKIQGEGQKKASEIRGNADAQVIKGYAEAISEVGEFYTFVRTLEAYEKAISNDTQLILTTDNAFLQQLQTLGSPSVDQIPTNPADNAPITYGAAKPVTN